MQDQRHQSENMIDYLRSNFRKYIIQFVMVLVAVFSLVAIFTFLRTPQFEATVRLVVKQNTNAILPSKTLVSEPAQNEADIVDTQVEILHSDVLLRRVVENLKLYADPEFSSESETSNRDVATRKLLKSLTIYRAGNTYIIDIIARSKDAVKAARIANALSKAYLKEQVATERRANRETNVLLLERIDEMAGAVEQAERAVQQFKIANSLMSVGGATLAAQSITAMENDLARARASEGAASGALQARQRSGSRLAAAATPALEQLLVQKADAEQIWEQARLVYGQLHPKYQDARARVHELRNAVADETGRARAALSAEQQYDIDRLKSEVASATQRRASLSRSVGGTRVALSENNEAQVRLNILERKAEAVRATYEAYLGRYQETSSQVGTEQPGARIFSPAVKPSIPASPDWALHLLFGLLLGLAIAMSMLVIRVSHDMRYDGET